MKSSTPPRPIPPIHTNTLLDRLDPTQRKVLLVGLVAFFLLAGFSTLLVAYYAFKPQITAYFNTPTPTLTPTSTPACVGSTLQIGNVTLNFNAISRATDGSINVPAGIPGMAYWIEDLENNYVFALSPILENLTLLSALHGGEEAVITWGNCNSSTYLLSAPQTGVPGTEIITDQAKIGIIIYLPETALAPGVMVQGGNVEDIFKHFETAEPSEYVIDAEVSLLETSTSADEKSIQITISVLNYGSVPFIISGDDVLINPEDIAPLSLISSEPSLPQEIKPQESKTLILIFPRPTPPTAVLKVFNIVYDLEDY